MNTLKLFVQAQGSERTELVELPQSAVVKDILTAARDKGVAVPSDDVLVFREEHEEPVDVGSSLHAAGIKDKSRIHIHRCRTIDVLIHFKAQDAHKLFAPSATLAKVHKWAANKFLPSELDRTEHELQICDTDNRPNPNTQVGALVKDGKCHVCFDLVPTERVEG